MSRSVRRLLAPRLVPASSMVQAAQAGAVGHRDVPEDHRDRDQRAAVEPIEPALVEGRGVAEAEEDARDGRRHDRQKIHGPAARPLVALDQVRQQERVERAGGRGGAPIDQRVAQRDGVRADIGKVGQGPRHVVGETDRQGADDEGPVDQHDHDGQQRARRKAGPRHAARHRRIRHGRGAPADGHIGVATALEAQVGDIQRQGQGCEDRADRGCPGNITITGDEAVGLRGQDVIAPGDQGRIAEVLEDVNGGDQRGRDQAGAGHRQGDASEDLPGPGPQVAGSLLLARVAAREHVGDQLVGKREKGDGLHAPEPVDPEHVPGLAEQIVGDDATRAKEQEIAGGDDEGRRQKGKDADELKEGFPPHVAHDHGIGINQPEHHGRGRGEGRRDDRVEQRPDPRGCGEKVHVAADPRGDDHLNLRIDDERRDQAHRSDEHQEKGRLAAQLAHDSIPGHKRGARRADRERPASPPESPIRGRLSSARA